MSRSTALEAAAEPPTERRDPRVLPSLPAAAAAPETVPSYSTAPPLPTARVVTVAPGVAPVRQRAPHPAEAPVVRRLVHPQGFRILRDSSAIERSLRGYFRLPPAPSAQLRAERARLQRTLLRVERDELRRTARATGGAGGVLLDGFLLLSASACEEPAAVQAVTLQASHLSGVIEEDLPYFTDLRFLDVSENALGLDELLGLPALETLHMACNRMRSLAGLLAAVNAQQRRSGQCAVAQPTPWGTRSLMADLEEDGEVERVGAGIGGRRGLTASTMSTTVHDVLMPTLVALNLSYNAIPVEHLCLLAFFPCLEKLDLSGNGLRRLPADLSCLASVTHLALENNGFTSAPPTGGHGDRRDVFLSLSTMPSLVEVNLNHNRLSRVPPLSVQDGSGLCFPSVEVIGLSGNRFAEPADVAPLAPLHRTLRRVVLSDNPISRSPAKASRAVLLFEQCIVDAYAERTRRDGTMGRSQRSQRSGPAGESAVAADDGDVRWEGESWSRLIPRTATDGASATVDTAAAVAVAMDESSGSSPASALSRKCTGTLAGSHNGRGTAARSAESADADDDDDKDARWGDAAEPQAPLGGTRGTADRTTTSLRDSFATLEDYFEAYYVNLVFHAANMPKRSTRYFYATQSRVAGQSALVTIPEHKEFMDIYRITGRTRAQVAGQRRPPGRAARTTAADQRSRHSAPPSPSASSSSSEDEEDEGDEPPPSPPPIGGEAAFFMTEMAGDSAVAPRRRAAPEASPGATPAAVAPGAATSSVPSLPAVSTPLPMGSVHTALNELKALLRRPLIPLPYAQGGGRSTRYME